MENQKYYAVLLNQYRIANKRYLLEPIGLVKGEIITHNAYHFFKATNGRDYCFADSGSTFDEVDSVVYFLIEEKQLKDKFFSIRDAEEKYFNQYKDCFYVSLDEGKEIVILPIKNPFSNELSSSKQQRNVSIENGDELNNTYYSFQKKVKEASSYLEVEEIIKTFQLVLSNLDGKITDDLARECIHYLNEIYHDFLLEIHQIYEDGENLGAIKYLTSSKLRNTERMIKTLAKDYDVICKKNEKPESSKYNQYGNLDIVSMKKYLDERVIGQEQAKIDVISAITMNQLIDNASNKRSCLLIGPTGSGKTLLATAISEYLDIPMKVYNTTGLTSAGYKGESIEDIMISLLTSAKGDLQKAQKGIVVLDEIDKKTSKKANDPAYRGVLNELLPFVQGSTYTIKYKEREYLFDTSWLNILATGSFAFLVESRNTSLYNTTKMGFGKAGEELPDYDIEYPELTEEDLHEAGVPMELLGRMPVITQLDGHTKKTLRTILTDYKESPLLTEKRALEKLHIKLSWTDRYLDAVASESLKKKTGARSLLAVVEKSVKMARYTAQEYLGTFSGILLTEEAVYNNLNCVLIDNDGKLYTTKEVRENQVLSNSSVKEYKKVNQKVNSHIL